MFDIIFLLISGFGNKVDEEQKGMKEKTCIFLWKEDCGWNHSRGYTTKHFLTSLALDPIYSINSRSSMRTWYLAKSKPYELYKNEFESKPYTCPID